MIAYKGFTPELTSRLGDGKKENCTFYPGAVMVAEESKTARTGYHCCENPFECLAYYSWNGKNRFWMVEAEGDIDEDEHERIACTKITLLEELSLTGFTAKGMIYMIQHQQRGKWQQDYPGVQVKAEKAEAKEEGHIAIARGKSPRVKGVEGSCLGLLLEKDGTIVAGKMIRVETDMADKWITINENREVIILEESAD